MDIYFLPEQFETNLATTMVVAPRKPKEKVIGVCEVVGDRFAGEASFGLAAQSYLTKYDGKKPMDVDISKVKIHLLSITQQPKHGRLVKVEDSLYGGSWSYYPDEAYFGKDIVEALVTVGEDVVRVKYNLLVQAKIVDQLTDGQYRSFCPRTTRKISSSLPSKLIRHPT